MAWMIYVFSVFVSAATFPHAPAISLVFAVVALAIFFEYELRRLADVLRASTPSPRTDP